MKLVIGGGGGERRFDRGGHNSDRGSQRGTGSSYAPRDNSAGGGGRGGFYNSENRQDNYSGVNNRQYENKNDFYNPSSNNHRDNQSYSGGNNRQYEKKNENFYNQIPDDVPSENGVIDWDSLNKKAVSY